MFVARVTVVVMFEKAVVLPGTAGVTTTGLFEGAVSGIGRDGCSVGGFVATESARMTRRGTADVPGAGGTGWAGWARSSATTTSSSVESWRKVFKVIISTRG